MLATTALRRPRTASELLLACALAATLVGLLWHAWERRFLTDDAYIAFRYARNLALGDGLVFNPGFERVEGYANFLWIAFVAGLYRLGVPCEIGAIALSLAATVALWACVVCVTLRELPARASRAWALVPAALLAITPSFATWSTSGMETRLFELLIFAGVVRAVFEARAAGSARPRPIAAVLLALATLTRPDGALITGACAAALLLTGARAQRRWLACSFAIWAPIVGAHLAFRLSYYGEWLPNVYYTKVDGRAWWDMGFKYLASFLLEYGAALWLPLIAAFGMHTFTTRRVNLPIAFAAVCGTHALYIASIGGDHFEYRPLDLYFPFAYVAIGLGAAHVARSPRSTAAVVANLAAVVALTLSLPVRATRDLPERFVGGFPGMATAAEQAGYLDPAGSTIYRLPGLRSIARLHRALLIDTTAHFVGLRREEHAEFVALALEEGARLRAVLDAKLIPHDTYLALDCVGAAPYVSDLRILDRLGLTDHEIARSPYVNERFMAHGKYAPIELAAERGVDLWAIDPLRLVWDADDTKLRGHLRYFHQRGEEVGFAAVGEGRVLLAWFPEGVEAARARFPALDLRSTLDGDAVLAMAR